MLNSKNISLMPFEKKHLDNTRKWANDPCLQNLIMRQLPVTEADQQAWYENVRTDKSKVVFAICLPEDNTHIGNCGIYDIDAIHRRGELWILIGNTTFFGKGIGSEAVSELIGYGFTNLNLNRIYLFVDTSNTAAIKCYKKCGFIQEGQLRKHFYIDGCYRDMLVMSVLKSEYDEQKDLS